MFEMYQGGRAVIVMASFFCIRVCWPMSEGEEMLVREDWLVGEPHTPVMIPSCGLLLAAKREGIYCYSHWHDLNDFICYKS
ncbi:hypothetical protein GGI42DRAFT_225490 [Trichoderma sp. SZMC 28013]